MIVGDYASTYDMSYLQPFSGPAGTLLNGMLHEAKISRTECFATLIFPQALFGKPGAELDQIALPRQRCPRDGWRCFEQGFWVDPGVYDGYEALKRRINLVKPNLILVTGNLGLKLLAGKWGIKSWRGSTLPLIGVEGHACKVMPVYAPETINRDMALRSVTVHDFRRAAMESLSSEIKVPKYNFIIRPNFSQLCQEFARLRTLLSKGPVPISTDIETRAGHIACIGWATSATDAFCMPLMCVERGEGYWSLEEELYLREEFSALITHPNWKIIGQNWLYDAQYIFRFFFVRTYAWHDTMISQHCIFPGTPKGLDYLSSLYCDYYVYWKDDGKTWDPKKVSEDQLWIYNCEDCVRTFEVDANQFPAIARDPRLLSVWDFQQNHLVTLVFKAMLRGVRANTASKKQLKVELTEAIRLRHEILEDLLGHPINVNSPPQMQQLFYDGLGMKPVRDRATGRVTTNDKALEVFLKKEPLLTPLIKPIQDLRSLRVFLSTFVEAQLDVDQRLRSSFNVAGTETFRLSSSENAFGSGLNFQNIPNGSESDDPNVLSLPNVRKLFLPDEGYVIFDMDLDRADLQVVVWEADDIVLKEALRKGIDLHLLNAGSIFGINELNSDNLGSSEFLSYAKKKYGKQRQFCKAWVHGTNYGGKDRTMASTVGITVVENERFRNRWFGEHPGIAHWHKRTEDQLQKYRFVENRFGYRYTFFGRTEAALPEALAWIPQSTVGCVINRAWDNIDKQIPEAEVLIQVHDSLVGQVPIDGHEAMLPRIQEVSRIVIPYEDPLVIPTGINYSPVSWGHCK